MDANELMILKKRIDTAKTEVAEFEGKKKHVLQELKDDWSVSTIPQAKKKLEEMNKTITKLETELDKLVIEIEKIL